MVVCPVWVEGGNLLLRVVKYTCYGYYKNEYGRWVECDQKEISINQTCSKCREFKTDVVGDVVYRGKHYFVVQGEKYSECFLNVDIENGDYVITGYEGREKTGRKKNRK